MYCPNCRVEYREGFDRCNDCGVDLVAELPPEPEVDYAEAVTVYTAINENSANIAVTLLESAGIESIVQGQSGPDVFGALSPGFPVEVQVMPADVEAALQVLEELEEEPVTVYVAEDEARADKAIQLLEDAGIEVFECQAEPEDPDADIPAFPVEIQVMPEQVDAAKAALKDLPA